MTHKIASACADSVEDSGRPGEPPTRIGDGEALLRPAGKEAFALDQHVGQGAAHERRASSSRRNSARLAEKAFGRSAACFFRADKKPAAPAA